MTVTYDLLGLPYTTIAYGVPALLLLLFSIFSQLLLTVGCKPGFQNLTKILQRLWALSRNTAFSSELSLWFQGILSYCFQVVYYYCYSAFTHNFDC